MNVFVNILFGHLVGDFLLQPKSMAVKKSASNWTAVMHVSIYTIAMGFFTNWNLYWITFVWVSHFVIDRWSLADKWLQLIKGRDLPDFFYNGHEDISIEAVTPSTFKERKLNYRILRGSFHALVYTVVDATLHLAPMYYLYPYLVK